MQDKQVVNREKTPHMDAKEKVLGCVIFALTVFIAAFPSLKAGINFHGDIAFHLGRIKSLYLSLKAGVFPVKVHASLANSFGYGGGILLSGCAAVLSGVSGAGGAFSGVEL